MRCTIKDIDRTNRVLDDDSVYAPINGCKCPITKKGKNAKQLLDDSRVHVLMPNEFSVFIFLPHSIELYIGHSAILLEGRGRLGIMAGKSAAKWMFENTRCIKIFGLTPVFMKHVIKYNKLLGFVQEGLLKNSCVKDGVLYDQILFGLSK